MNTKHTPGPWRVAESLDGTMTEVMAGDIYIAPAVLQASVAGDGQQSEREANARLIAAAPDLLESLEDLMAMRTKCFIPNSNDWWDRKALAAIAKARGEK